MARKKKSYKSKAMSVARTAVKALQVANQVRGLLNVEFKKYDTAEFGRS